MTHFIFKFIRLTLFIQVYVCQNANIWPYPQNIVIEKSFFTIDKNVNFNAQTTGNCGLLQPAIDRYKQLIFIEDCLRVGISGNKTLFDSKINLATLPGYRGDITEIIIKVTQKCDTIPHIEMDESYKLTIGSHNNVITAPNIWGAIRALETLSQLIVNVGQNQFIVNITEIQDYPRFKHRGLALDTSRHFISVQNLLKNLDAMAYNKLNVFHWHIVDDQSFPYVSQSFPKLSSKGAYDPKNLVYTPDDIRTVVKYATQRGIRVLVEFDTPGHTLSWGRGQSGLLTTCYDGSDPNGRFGPIDPSKDSTYNFLVKFFTEVVGLFPDKYLHLDADEVDYDCWRSNPDIKAFMKAKDYGNDYTKLQEYYLNRLFNIAKTLNNSYIVWNDVLDNGVHLATDAIVHLWYNEDDHHVKWQKVMADITKQGYTVILSSPWYLNVIDYGNQWKNYHLADPQEFEGTDHQKSLVIGGEVVFWSEYLDSASFIPIAWPRSSSVAERLWSSKKIQYSKSTDFRYNRQNCLMQIRGIRVDATTGPGFCRCDYAQ